MEQKYEIWPFSAEIWASHAESVGGGDKRRGVDKSPLKGRQRVISDDRATAVCRVIYYSRLTCQKSLPSSHENRMPVHRFSDM